MADRWYNAPLGAQIAQDVAEGATDTGQYAAFRVTFDATGNSREQAILSLDAIRMVILQDTWPPV